jgi:pyruvate dehydrogenase E1 component beta subunit
LSVELLEQQLTVREALTRALAGEIERSSDVVVMGETVRDGGAAGVTAGLFDRFGPTRVIETPVSENGFLGAALGLALAGFSPVVEIYSADFLLAVANELANDMAKWRQQQARRRPLAITVRGCMGANGGLGPEHSQAMEPFFHHAHGLTIVTPSTVGDAVGLLRSSVRSPGPVLFLEHRRVYDVRGDFTEDPDSLVPLGVANVIATGGDVTIVAWGWMRHEAEAATLELNNSGVGVDLIDPRTIRPMDWATIEASVARTGRLVVLEEAQVTGSVAGEILARCLENGPRGLRAARVTMPDRIHPYSADMEASILPDRHKAVQAVRKLLDG